MVTVGGSGVGADLLRQAIAAYPAARRLVPGLRMVVVDRAADRPGARCPPPTASRCAATSTDLYQHLAACDLAVVQGGLTTTMELAAAGRPFLYFPLRPPLRAELPRHGTAWTGTAPAAAWTTTDRARGASPPAIAAEIGRPVSYRPVETDGAARAASLIAELL